MILGLDRYDTVLDGVLEQFGTGLEVELLLVIENPPVPCSITLMSVRPSDPTKKTGARLPA